MHPETQRWTGHLEFLVLRHDLLKWQKNTSRIIYCILPFLQIFYPVMILQGIYKKILTIKNNFKSDKKLQNPTGI